jgi:hypothetical protein
LICYEADSLFGLLDKKLSQISHRKAVASKVISLCSYTRAALPTVTSPTFTEKHQRVQGLAQLQLAILKPLCIALSKR